MWYKVIGWAYFIQQLHTHFILKSFLFTFIYCYHVKILLQLTLKGVCVCVCLCYKRLVLFTKSNMKSICTDYTTKVFLDNLFIFTNQRYACFILFDHFSALFMHRYTEFIDQFNQGMEMIGFINTYQCENEW